jgi:hypothetical protein
MEENGGISKKGVYMTTLFGVTPNGVACYPLLFLIQQGNSGSKKK